MINSYNYGWQTSILALHFEKDVNKTEARVDVKIAKLGMLPW